MKRTMLGCLLAVAVIGTLSAQPKQSAKKMSSGSLDVKKGAAALKVNVQPFSLAALDSGRVDPNYKGAPPGAVIAAIEQITQLTRGEFESSAEFEQRRQASVSTSFMGNLTLESLIPFVAEVKGFVA